MVVSCSSNAGQSRVMPSLLRFLTVVAVLAGLGYLAVFALANLVEPQPRQMTVTITPDKFVKD